MMKLFLCTTMKRSRHKNKELMTGASGFVVVAVGQSSPSMFCSVTVYFCFDYFMAVMIISPHQLQVQCSA